MSHTIRLDVCKTGVLKSLEDGFTHRLTFINEALQNARRAHATHIDITLHPDTSVMTISDDGDGMTDFTPLLTIGQSGWDPDILDSEHPFGIGAAAMFFAATTMTIESLSQQITFHSQDLLHGIPATIEPLSPSFPGTRITLTLNQHTAHHPSFLESIEAIVKGFPLPVSFNGQRVERPDAPHREYLTTPVGQLWIGPLSTITPNISFHPKLYLQGFRLDRSYRWHDSTILHLDPRHFRARVPDRTMLIDDHHYPSIIKDTIKAAARERLLTLRDTMSPHVFVNTYAVPCRATENDDLLFDLPLPYQDCFSLTVIPISLANGEEEDLYLTQAEEQSYSAEQPPSQPVTTVQQITWDEDARAGAYALAMNYLVVDDVAVPRGHWLQSHIIPLASYRYSITPVNPQPITDMDIFRYGALRLFLCDAITLTPTAEDPTFPALPPITITDHFIFDAFEEAAYCPLSAIDGHGSFGNLLRQIDDYCDEHDHYAEHAFDRDRTTMATIVTMTRHHNPTALMTHVLQSMPDAYKALLANHTFSATIQSDHTMTVSSGHTATTS